MFILLVLLNRSMAGKWTEMWGITLTLGQNQLFSSLSTPPLPPEKQTFMGNFSPLGS